MKIAQIRNFQHSLSLYPLAKLQTRNIISNITTSKLNFPLERSTLLSSFTQKRHLRLTPIKSSPSNPFEFLGNKPVNTLQTKDGTRVRTLEEATDEFFDDSLGIPLRSADDILTVPSRTQSFLEEEDNGRTDKKRRHLNVIVVDMQGNKTEKVVTKHQLLRSLKLAMRDLRTVDTSSFPAGLQSQPSILVRDQTILVNMLHIRAIVLYDSVLIFENKYAPEIQHFITLLEQTTDPTNTTTNTRFSIESEYDYLPFELKALEAILTDTYQTLYAEYRKIEPLIQEQLDKISVNPDGVDTKNLLKYRNNLSQLSKIVQAVHTAIHQVWESDEDMAAMYLTAAKKGLRRQVEQHEEVETLLEAYLRQIEHINTEVVQLQQEIVATDEYLNIQLDYLRNKIMRLSLVLSVGSFSSAFCGLTAAIFGMNLTSSFESHPYAFYIVSTTIFTANVLMIAGYYFYCKSKRIL